jgi:hypothetical protein
MIPAVAHDDGHEHDDASSEPASAEDPSFDPEPIEEPRPEDAIASRDELIAIEKQVDPQGSPAVFVCANNGAFEYKLVEGTEVPADAKVNPLPGLLDREAADPCAGFDWVVGR